MRGSPPFWRQGADAEYRSNSDEDLVIGIPVAFWSFAGDVSPLCGEKVVVYAGEKKCVLVPSLSSSLH